MNKKIDRNTYEYLEKILWPNQTIEQEKSCLLPKLELIGHNYQEPYRECSPKPNWGFLKRGHWHINKTATYNFFRMIKCKYSNITRIDDFNYVYSKYSMLKDGQRILNENIHVVCLSQFQVYSNIHTQIFDRLDEFKENGRYLEEDKKFDEKCEPMNILIIVYDSISRVHWLKHMPKLTRTILEELNFEILYGQTIIGDGTLACFIPLFTGKLESELPSAHKTDANAKYVDEIYPLIWNILNKKGKFLLNKK